MARCGLRFPRREELPIEVAPELNLEVPAAADHPGARVA